MLNKIKNGELFKELEFVKKKKAYDSSVTEEYFSWTISGHGPKKFYKPHAK